jgi:hypothetical protein
MIEPIMSRTLLFLFFSYSCFGIDQKAGEKKRLAISDVAMEGEWPAEPPGQAQPGMLGCFGSGLQ